MKGAPRSSLTLDEFAKALRERFPPGTNFRMVNVKKAKITGVAINAVHGYVYELHDRGDISHADVPRGGSWLVFNEHPTACHRCLERKRLAEEKANAQEAHLPADIVRDIRDVLRLSEKVKGTRLGEQIEDMFNELRALAEIIRCFK